jgi:HEAT repeat protein
LDARWEKNEGISQVVPTILKALTHSDYWVSQSAAKLLEMLKIDPNNLPADKSVASAKKPTMETAPHPALHILAEMLVDRDRDFRLAAAVALGGLREKNAASLLSAAANDSDDTVRKAVQTALAALN